MPSVNVGFYHSIELQYSETEFFGFYYAVCDELFADVMSPA